MSAESYRAAMVAPIKCRGSGCQQGRCGSPLKCSGSEQLVDRSISAFQLHRASLPIATDESRDTPPVTAESVQGMAVSGWCWSGLVLSVGVWSVLAWLLLRAFRVL